MRFKSEFTEDGMKGGLPRWSNIWGKSSPQTPPGRFLAIGPPLRGVGRGCPRPPVPPQVPQGPEAGPGASADGRVSRTPPGGASGAARCPPPRILSVASAHPRLPSFCSRAIAPPPPHPGGGSVSPPPGNVRTPTPPSAPPTPLNSAYHSHCM